MFPAQPIRSDSNSVVCSVSGGLAGSSPRTYWLRCYHLRARGAWHHWPTQPPTAIVKLSPGEQATVIWLYCAPWPPDLPVLADPFLAFARPCTELNGCNTGLRREGSSDRECVGVGERHYGGPQKLMVISTTSYSTVCPESCSALMCI